MKHTMSKPCAECPFRSDVHPYLRGERVTEIAESLFRGDSFPCHKTVDFDEEDERVRNPDEVQCAGAEIFLAHQGRSTQMARISERLGLPVAELDMEAPVFRSESEMREHHDPDSAEIETCSVVDDDCEAPAGMVAFGGVISGREAAEFECYACGEPVCGPCSDVQEWKPFGVSAGEQRICRNCSDSH